LGAGSGLSHGPTARDRSYTFSSESDTIHMCDDKWGNGHQADEMSNLNWVGSKEVAASASKSSFEGLVRGLGWVLGGLGQVVGSQIWSNNF
jgi:hypothetical protein